MKLASGQPFWTATATLNPPAKRARQAPRGILFSRALHSTSAGPGPRGRDGPVARDLVQDVQGVLAGVEGVAAVDAGVGGEVSADVCRVERLGEAAEADEVEGVGGEVDVWVDEVEEPGGALSGRLGLRGLW